MSAMTREVLMFARGESNLLIRKVYVQKFMDEVEQQLTREFGGKNVALDMKVLYLGAAYFDELKLFRLIHNLARNAAQAMDRGGIFTIIVDTDGPDLVMIFTDTGRGIPESMQGRLFEAFATAEKADGTGLGLAIVKKIVDEHQGRISVDTRAGEGTTFKVVIPRDRAPT
jgi:signal transduction histidine kinase